VEAEVITRSTKAYAGALLAAVTSIAMSAPVICQADEPTPAQFRVTYSDLNLNTAEGAKRLYARLERSANYACGTSATDMEVMMNAPGPCVGDAIAHAVRDVNRSTLTKLYIDKHGADVARQFGISDDTRTARN